MHREEEKKACDILSDERFRSDSLLCESEVKNDSDESELYIARIIFSFLNTSRKTPRIREKDEVRRQLKISIQRANKRKMISRWTVAASLLVVIFSVWQVRNNTEQTDFVGLVETLSISKPDSATQLILNDGRQVLISEEESKIVYDQKGENIVIDSEQTITQTVESKKPVFNTLVVPYGKRTQITLADGSKVWLNSGSKLLYPAANTGDKREVYIDGEAIFDVTHIEGRPFYVKTKDFEIKVLGTIFNVCSYSDEENPSTVLAEGKIELSPNSKNLFQKEKRTIFPGTRAVFDTKNQLFKESIVNTTNYLSWRDGYLIMEKEPLENILKKIARYYNAEIELQNTDIGKETFSGNLNLRNTPEEVLSIIAETTSFTIHKEKNKLIINLN
ncbi:FecR domain-containing protein [Maribellus sp. CM-23]|uniref:FecR family protein n=1 Tax=Maribellus sp. CM-23 TaxID=2781026 RepID=UPI001F48CD81|nr:FecR domain-containing protein [Maribellus sp. CM-23]MCE4563470.1 FecR domain-containing protein [Maribellus sp. CM-23]